MATPLLQTKLYIPPARAEWVSRPRLIERLRAGLDRRLTLVSAPAGFGKTTLLSQCVAHCARLASEVPVAWLSLDQEDNDPARFWRYAIAALQTLQPKLGEVALASVQATPTPPIEQVLVTLINEVAAAGMRRAVLVLDDFHLITEPSIHQGMVYLLDNLPPPPGGLHLILSSRADLPWPIARMRARNELTELRPADLRFTSQEAAAFLNDAAGLGLSAEDVTALDARTEGWIAGLQMAALALQATALQAQGSQAPAMQAPDARARTTFIQTLTASHRFILDYLVEEVLDRQPPDLQAFLLQTSVLDQMTAPLCDAVCAIDRQEAGQAMLDRIEQSNLFLIPLDDERRWYRYHHLFADLLRRRLERTHPDQVPLLHRRAGGWYEQNGLIAAAIGHALRAGDVERVARLARRNALAMMDYDELATVVRWLHTLPDSALRSRPWLGIACAWAHFYMGHLDAVELQLQAIEAGLDVEAGPDAQELAGHVAAVRCYAAAIRGEMAQAKRIADQALRLLPQEEQAMRGFVVALQSVFFRWSGDLVAASQTAAQAVSLSRAAQDNRVIIEALVIHGALLHTQGQLSAAFDVSQEALLLADESARQGGRHPPVVASVHRLVSLILYQRNDLPGALRHVQQGIALAREWGGVEDTAFGYMGLARVLQGMGDARGALDASQAGMQQAGTFSSWFAGYGAAQQARLWLEQGNLAAAAGWARESGLRPADEPEYQYLLEYSVLASVLVAQGRIDQALALLDRLLKVAETAGAGLPLIETLLLRALALHGQGRDEQALASLARAIDLAKPEGMVRTFVDHGAPMEALLQKAARAGIEAGYARTLLAALHGETSPQEPGPQAAPPAPTLTEPLSDREREVLRFLDTHLSAPQIAEELVVSRHTIRTHIKHIYDKLGAHSRTEAVERARELGLL